MRESFKIVVLVLVCVVGCGIVHGQIAAAVCGEYFTVGRPPVWNTRSPQLLALGWSLVAAAPAGLLLAVGSALAARIGPRPKLAAHRLRGPVAILLIATCLAALATGIAGYFAAAFGQARLNGPLALQVPPWAHCAYLANHWALVSAYVVCIVGGMLLWCWIAGRRRQLAAESAPRYDLPAMLGEEPLGPTLYEDWLARRDHLARAPLPWGQYRETMIRVLDYLIARYGDAPEAARPARFALTSDLYVNQRAIVVHHHLWPDEPIGVKDQREAQQRVASFVRRIMTPRPEAETTAEAEEGVATGAGPPRLPFWVSDPRLEDPWFRTTCEELDEAVFEWRDLLAGGRLAEARETLRPFLRRRKLHPLLAERIRPELASDFARVRLSAIAILGWIGGLDDLGLLADLLSLAPQADEHPRERDALVRAIERVSGASKTPST